MAINVNDLIRVTYFQRMFQQRLLAVLHMRVVTAPAGASSDLVAMTNLANKVGDPAQVWVAAWRAIVTNQVLFDEVRCQKVFPVRGIYGKSAMAVTGSESGAASTANTAISIEKRSRIPGRKGIGRIQIAGSRIIDLVDGSFDPTYLSAVQSAGEQLIGLVSTPLDGGVYAWCLPGPTPLTSDNDISDVQAKDTVRTMHRRTVQVGK